jgi:crossover junction endodeoxyribonuclease RuvC
MKPYTIAIDPGSVSGAYALFDGSSYTVGDLPTVGKEINGHGFFRLISESFIQCAVIEQVSAMPKQGVSSTFNFGYAAGVIYGVLIAHGVRVKFVRPNVWKKHFKLVGKDKEASRALALQKHPNVLGLDLKKHHGRAEALLMLEWFAENPS